MQQDIVIFAPHQDDEILGAYEIIRRQPERCHVVFLTNGDYEGAQVAKNRWQESRRALEHLGVPESHMIALGYADTGMQRDVSFLWRLWHADAQTVISSKVGAQTYHPDGGQEYHLAHWGEHAAYTRQAVLADVRVVLEEIRPGTIYMTNEDDVHGDHAAAPLFIQAAIAQMEGYEPELLRYHVHGGDDERWPNRIGDTFEKPFNLDESQWNNRMRVSVSDPEDFLHTLELFQSQWCDAEYMTSFVKKEQLFYPAKP